MKSDQLWIDLYWRKGWLFELTGFRVDGGKLAIPYVRATPAHVLAGAVRNQLELYAVTVNVIYEKTEGDWVTASQYRQFADPQDRDPPLEPSTPLVGFADRHGAADRARALTYSAGLFRLRQAGKKSYVALGQGMLRYSTKKMDAMLYGQNRTQMWLSDWRQILR